MKLNSVFNTLQQLDIVIDKINQNKRCFNVAIIDDGHTEKDNEEEPRCFN